MKIPGLNAFVAVGGEFDKVVRDMTHECFGAFCESPSHVWDKTEIPVSQEIDKCNTV